jgi:hypothetical protein
MSAFFFRVTSFSNEEEKLPSVHKEKRFCTQDFHERSSSLARYTRYMVKHYLSMNCDEKAIVVLQINTSMSMHIVREITVKIHVIQFDRLSKMCIKLEEQ